MRRTVSWSCRNAGRPSMRSCSTRPRSGIPVVELEGGTLTSLAGFDGHQGVALVVAERRWATLDEILARRPSAR
ncbi:MAG: hypothetical protein WKF78_03405 [Candidatus Limnocylindrales bacterium]